jgi:hypothetical protein
VCLLNGLRVAHITFFNNNSNSSIGCRRLKRRQQPNLSHLPPRYLNLIFLVPQCWMNWQVRQLQMDPERVLQKSNPSLVPFLPSIPPYVQLYCLIGVKGHPAKVQDWKRNDERKDRHQLQFHIHNLCILLVEIFHFGARHVSSFDIGEIFLFLFASKDRNLSQGSGANRQGRLRSKGIGQRHQGGNHGHKSCQKNNARNHLVIVSSLLKCKKKKEEDVISSTCSKMPGGLTREECRCQNLTSVDDRGGTVPGTLYCTNCSF